MRTIAALVLAIAASTVAVMVGVPPLRRAVVEPNFAVRTIDLAFFAALILLGFIAIYGALRPFR